MPSAIHFPVLNDLAATAGGVVIVDAAGFANEDLVGITYVVATGTLALVKDVDDVKLAIQAASDQSLDLMQLKDSGGTPVCGFDALGNGLIDRITFVLGFSADGSALLSDGANKTTVAFLAANAHALWQWQAYAETNPSGSGGGFTFDIKRNGTSIFATPQAVPANTTAVQSGNTFEAGMVTSGVAGDKYRIDISGSGTAVKNVVVILYLLTRNR